MKTRIAMVVFTLITLAGAVAAGAYDNPVSTAATNRCCDGGDPDLPIKILSPKPNPRPQPAPQPKPKP